MRPKQGPPCPGCNGTGQMTYFGGVSRFQFSYEDCPECNGFGFLKATPENTLSAEHIAAHSSLSPVQAEQFLKVLAQTLSAALVQGENIRLRGFGSFCGPSFTPGKSLTQSINTPE